jgi:endonuclease I
MRFRKSGGRRKGEENKNCQNTKQTRMKQREPAEEAKGKINAHIFYFAIRLYFYSWTRIK